MSDAVERAVEAACEEIDGHATGYRDADGCWHEYEGGCRTCRAIRAAIAAFAEEVAREMAKIEVPVERAVCKHGGLARSCEICERDARIRVLESALRSLRIHINHGGTGKAVLLDFIDTLLGERAGEEGEG